MLFCCKFFLQLDYLFYKIVLLISIVMFISYLDLNNKIEKLKFFQNVLNCFKTINVVKFLKNFLTHS